MKHKDDFEVIVMLVAAIIGLVWWVAAFCLGTRDIVVWTWRLFVK